MNILLTILAIIGGLIVLLLLIALFTKKSYRVDRSITISRPLNEVFDYMRHIKNQDQYNKWVMRDPNMKKNFKGNDGEVGFIYDWEGNSQAGAGEQEIKKIDTGKQIDLEIRFRRPFKAVAGSIIKTNAAANNATNLQWSFSSDMKYPMNLFILMGIEKQLGKDLEETLGNLKAILERK